MEVNVDQNQRLISEDISFGVTNIQENSLKNKNSTLKLTKMMQILNFSFQNKENSFQDSNLQETEQISPNFEQITKNIKFPIPTSTTLQLIHKASETNNIDYLNQIINKGINLQECKDFAGKNALHFASEKGHVITLQFLLENGVDLESKDFFGKNALIYSAISGNFDNFLFLLQKGFFLMIDYLFYVLLI